MSKFHRTAISRRNYSTPVQYLLKNDLIQGQTLDYGCGRGGDVKRLLEAGYLVGGYDPNGTYNNCENLKLKYETVICNFVLNVVEDIIERISIEEMIISRLIKGGTAYISVRNDPDVQGGVTSTGTWQGMVEPCKMGWELVTRNAKFTMWKYTK